MTIHPSSRIYSEEFDKWAALLIVSGVATLFISAGFALGWVGVFIATGLTLLLVGVVTMTEQGIRWKLGVHSSWCERRFDELVLKNNEAHYMLDQALKQRSPHEVRVNMIDNHPGILIVTYHARSIPAAMKAFEALGVTAEYACIYAIFAGARWNTIIVLPPEFVPEQLLSTFFVKQYQEAVEQLKTKVLPHGKLYQL